MKITGRSDAAFSFDKMKFCLNLDKLVSMLIKRTDDDKIVITLSSSMDSVELQRLIDYIQYLEATANSKATQEEVDKLARDVKKGWWKRNRKRLVG